MPDTASVPTGRPKRLAASKAEGFLRNLALAGGVPGGSHDSSKIISNQGGSGGGSAGAADAPGGSSSSPAAGSPDSSSSEIAGNGSSPGNAGGGAADGEASGSGSGGGSIARQQPKRKRSNGLGNVGRVRDGKKKGEVKTTTGGGRGGGSGRGGGGNGRGQPGLKRRRAATSASIGKVLDRLNGWGAKVRNPANRSLEDIWRGVDVVLRNLPETGGLTVDTLVGHARLRRYVRENLGPAEAGGGGGSGSGCSGKSVSSVLSFVRFFVDQPKKCAEKKQELTQLVIILKIERKFALFRFNNLPNRIHCSTLRHGVFVFVCWVGELVTESSHRCRAICFAFFQPPPAVSLLHHTSFLVGCDPHPLATRSRRAVGDVGRRHAEGGAAVSSRSFLEG